MKRFLFLILAFMQGCVAYAASPGTAAFNANQFSTNNNRISIKYGVLLTNAVVSGEITSDSTATGSIFMGDGGSFGYRITPQTMSGFINFIPDTSAKTGVPYHANTGTNVVETHLSLESFGYGLWTNNAGVIQSTLTNVTVGTSGVQPFIAMHPGLIDMRAPDATNSYNGMQLWVGNDYWALYGFNGAGNFIVFDPYNNDGLPAPYYLSTPNPVSSGNLFAVANNGTNKFVVPWDGAVQIPGDATANSLTITNDLNVHGSIKVNTLVVTNNVQFYNNTYVSNIYVTNILTAAGSSVFNTFTAESGTVSNNLTVLGNYVGTIDPAQTGTTLKSIKSLKLQFPRLVDGTGCTYANTNDYTALTFMLPQFSGTGATNANYCDFAFRVPTDLDTTVDLTASLTIRLTAADTAAHTYDVGMVSIANSGAAAGTPATYVALTVAGDGSGASGDIEGVSAVTLTSWKSNLTAGQWCLLRLNRDGANDASTVASNLMELEIFYTSTQ